MHPILGNPTRFSLYLAAWVPVAVLLTVMLSGSGGDGRVQAAAVVFPMCAIYAFVCQSSWYLCKFLPLQTTEPLRLIGTHAMAAVVLSALWAGLGEALTWMLGTTSYFQDYREVYAAQWPLVFSAGVVLFLLAAAFNYLFITFEASQESEKKALELQVLARDAELKALRAQIDPHFLFNSLNSINALITADPAAARRMCILLADFLRGCLKLGSVERIPFGEELRLAEQYLDIERVRLGARLTIERHVDPECEGCHVPPLIMQPLVENAILHGVGPMLDGGTVRIEARRHGDVLRLVLENPFESGSRGKNSAGLGLQNVKSRLTNLFNGDARLGTSRNDGKFRVEVDIPCEKPL